MIPKILHWAGLTACVLLIVACFLPWTFHADINETFTGLYTYKNQYGRPGKLLIQIAVLVFTFMILPKIWAKRINLFLCALGVGYAIKSYVLFASCYNAYCPEKKIGLYLMLISILVMMVATIFPNMKLKPTVNKETN
jgi:hypothetical protein